MPQFDISSFPVQILWLVVLLVVMYVFITHQFLPIILFLVKMRSKLYTKNLLTSYKLIAIKDINLYNKSKY